MVCRDAITNGSRKVCPLVINTPEERSLYNLGERKLDKVTLMSTSLTLFKI